MFSDGLLFLGLTVGLLAAQGSVHAQSNSSVDGAPEARKSGMSSGYSRDVRAAGTDLLIDRSEIESMPEMVDSLLLAITRLSNYEKPSATPRVSKIARAEIERTMCRGPCAVKAWYLPDEGIFLDDSLMPETNLVHRSILLHELVHFVQDVNAEGESMEPCDRWLHRERQAYALQNQYLARIGNTSSHMMMVSNHTWVATNRHICAGSEQAAGADSVESRQLFKESGQQAPRQ
jgi:hypothetical protein